jgi:hypothetical protein
MKRIVLSLALIAPSVMAAPATVSCGDLAKSYLLWSQKGHGVLLSYLSHDLQTRLTQKSLYGSLRYMEGSCDSGLVCRGTLFSSQMLARQGFLPADAQTIRLRLEPSGRILRQTASVYESPLWQECFENAEGAFIRSAYADSISSALITITLRKQP